MFISNKYTKWYFNIIDSRRKFSSTGYTERHHIVPKSLGGLNDETNLVALTAREHFVCHLLLIKMTEGQNKMKMSFAAHCMLRYSSNHDRIKANSHSYELIRKSFSKSQSLLHTGRKRSIDHNQKLSGENHWTRNKPGPMSGKTHTTETIEKLSGENHPFFGIKKEKHPMYGHKHSEETKLKMSNSAKKRDFSYLKRPLSEEHKSNLSASHKGKHSSLKGTNQYTLTCPHCGKNGGASIMKRWHFENCSTYKEAQQKSSHPI